MKLYPVLFDLEERTVTVVGGGEVALRKIRDLLEAGASVRIISPVVHEEILSLEKNFPRKLEILRRVYSKGDLAGSFLVYTTSDNLEVNRSASQEAGSLGIPVNMTDDPEGSTFFIPSFVRKGDFMLAVSTGGASPAMAARLRRSLSEHVPADIDKILDALSRARDVLKTSPEFSTLVSAQRGDLLRSLVSDDALLVELVKADAEGKLTEFLLKLGE